MTYTVLSLFPAIFEAYFSSSIMAKAVTRDLVTWRLVNIRDYAEDKHKTCDDAPYGGGAGMLMLARPLCRALEAAGARKKTAQAPRPRVVYLSPSGAPFSQRLAADLAREPELVLVCGRYEGIDQRVIDLYVDDEISVGDYVLSSGEVAALALIDATYRLLDRVIRAESLDEESFEGGLLEYPQWTRPEKYDNLKVPEVLLSGHHEHIRKWRLQKRLEKTHAVRPDLLEKGLRGGVFDAETLAMIEIMQKKAGEDGLEA
ncbi:MAG: tRNA (guanosine(37)-N1)-methyltransferase TrmD [Spirochaetaceae bacterium]|jgi:tRNA (guanine37-N1)-methyltransferase|nr:tRNA (guanosine(37)-N1)-methyltransferase TrmD [Spirochaetaceae bacterium]